jgi:hypothetical protein
MSGDVERIRDRLDLGQIGSRADIAAWQLRDPAHGGVATIVLHPGDATSYPIIVVGPSRNMGFGGGDYLVCLASGFGRAYAWAGQPMHADYCADKWSSDGNLWTGVVIAEFLSALSDALKAVTA